MSDNVTDLTLQILQQLRQDIGSMRSELTAVRDDLRGELHPQLGTLRSEIGELRAEMRTEFTAVRDEMRGMRADLTGEIVRTNARLEHFIETCGVEFRSLKESLLEQALSVAAIDARLSRLEARSERDD